MKHPNYITLSRRRFSRWLKAPNFSFNRIREDSEYFLERIESITEENQSPLVVSTEDNILQQIAYDKQSGKFYLKIANSNTDLKVLWLSDEQIKLLIREDEIEDLINGIDLQSHHIGRLLRHDSRAEEFFLDYTYRDGDEGMSLLPITNVVKYTKAAEVLNLMTKVRNYYGQHRWKMNLSSKQFFRQVIEIVVIEKIGLPKSTNRLREKWLEYRQFGYSSLVDRNFGNKNAIKNKK